MTLARFPDVRCITVRYLTYGQIISVDDIVWSYQHWTVDMPPNFRFSIFLQGRLALPAMLLSSQALRRTLMIASDNNEARAAYIFQHVEETGLCRLFTEDKQTGYVIEKVLSS